MVATSIRAANALAILVLDDRQMWHDISPLLGLLPEGKKEAAKAILSEGEITSATIIDAAMDLNAGFRQLAGASVLSRDGLGPQLSVQRFKLNLQHAVWWPHFVREACS